MSMPAVAEIVAPSRPRAGEERIDALDLLRAVAMFLGIALHAAMVFGTERRMPGMGTDVSRHWGFDVMLGLIHGFRMHLFFFLCGFFARLVYLRMGPGGFVKQRLKRIGIPFAAGLVTLVPAVIFIAMWGFVRNGEPIPQPSQGEGFRGYPTMHLWFLNYLLGMYAVAVMAALAGKFVPSKFYEVADRIFDAQLGKAFSGLLFVPITVALLWTGAWWGEPKAPIYSIWPVLRTFAHYLLFFGAGWWMHRRREKLMLLREGIKGAFVLAAFGIGTMGVLFHLESATDHPHYIWLKTGCIFGAALYSWTMTFAVTGFFLKYFAQPPRWSRYMADASYWCYLTHLPIVLLLQILVARWPLPASLKFVFIIGATMAVLLALYEYRVRYTWVGRILNGPRARANIVESGAGLNRLGA